MDPLPEALPARPILDALPHEEHDMFTEHGCTMLFVQYPGPTTGARPVYEGRFDERANTSDADMDLER